MSQDESSDELKGIFFVVVSFFFVWCVFTIGADLAPSRTYSMSPLIEEDEAADSRNNNTRHDLMPKYRYFGRVGVG